MKFIGVLQVLFIATQMCAKRLFTKIIGTPICDVGNLCSIHHLVLLKQTPFVEGETHCRQVYAVDFSPSDDISEPGTAWKIFLGRKIPGKVRLFYFDQIDINDLLREPLHQLPTYPIQCIRRWDRELYNKIRDWRPTFQLYTRNCQHFGRYISTNIVEPNEAVKN